MSPEELRKLTEETRRREESLPRLGGARDAPGRETEQGAIDLARFAVDAHNKNATMKRLEDAYMRCTGLKSRLRMAACMSNHLEFEKLVKVREQELRVWLYYFTIEAKDGEAKKLYEAKVCDCPWENIMELKDFKPVDC